MRIILPALVLFALSCHQQETAQRHSGKYDSYQKLLSRFKTISFDTLEVFPLNDLHPLKGYQFEGKELDSSEAVLFPGNIAAHHFIDPPGLFACYKFQIDSIRTGLIARTPSEYFPSSIKLFIYTTNKDTLVEVAELAESIGDAGAFMDINSWLYHNKDQTYSVFKWRMDGEQLNEERDSTTNTWDAFSLQHLPSGKIKELGTKRELLPTPLRELVNKKDPPKPM